jgi:hypothetical protein
MALPGTCEEGDRIWLCLARVRKGKYMALSGTCEEGDRVWLCLARVRKVTENGSAWHV